MDNQPTSPKPPKIQIYYVIPREEEKYKKIFSQGKTWHNNLWQTTAKFEEVLLYYKDLVKKQKEWVETYKNREKIEKKTIYALQKWFKKEYNILKKVERREILEGEVRRRLEEKLREIKRLKEKLKKSQKKPAETKKTEKKKKQEIDNEETRKKLARLKEIKKIIKEKLGEFVEKPDLEEEKKRLEEELREKLEELRSLKEIEELENEIREIKEEEGLERVYTTNDLWPYLDESKVEKFQEWEDKFGEIEEVELGDDTILDPVQTLTKIKKQKEEEELKGENPYEAFLLKQTDWEIVFNWTPYQKEWDKETKEYKWIRDDNGKLAPIFANLDKFLFNYQGLWYEFSTYEKKNWNKVEITANYSIYWNDYWYLLAASANGILYNSTKLITEVCACPDFTQSEETTKNVFVVTNYELKFDLLRAYGHKRKESNWYLLWLNGEEGKTRKSNNPNFPWIKLGGWKKVDWSREFFTGDRDFVWHLLGENNAEEDVAKGKNEQLFTLVSQRVKSPEETSSEHFVNLEAWTDVTIKKEGERMEMKRGRLAKEFVNWVDDKTPEANYPKELNHCLTNHIECSIQWRDKTVWKGNLNEIEGPEKEKPENRRLYLKLHETSNCSGTVVSFHDKYGNAIAQVHESIFIKIGKADENNVILNTIITAGAAAAITAATAGVGAAVAGKAVGAAAAAGAAKGAAAGGIGAFAGGVKGRLMSQGETIREEFTIDEFQHKFLRKGHWPVSFILEQDNELINRYHANRTLKGIEGNQYFNTAVLGNYLTENQFFRAKLLTLNMWGKKEWFKEKIEEGVRISDGTFAVKEEDWYRLEPPRKRRKSTGAGAPGDIDTLEIIDRVERKTIGTFNQGDKVPSYQTYLYTNDDNLYRQIRVHFGGHTTNGGTVSASWNSRITGQKNAFCWGCDCKAFKAPIEKGGEVVFLSKVGGTEQRMQVPNNCTIICDPNQGVFDVEIITKKTIHRKTSGEPPEGFNTPPPPNGPPGGSSGLPDNLEPSDEPNPNEFESEEQPEITADIDGMGLEVEPEEEPDDPEPEGEPEDDPDDPEDDPWLEDEKEKEQEEEQEQEDEIGDAEDWEKGL